MSQQNTEWDPVRLAEAVRAACLAAAREGYEEASMRGLCHEGAWECAIGAIQSLDVRRLLVPQHSELPPKDGEEDRSPQSGGTAATVRGRGSSGG
jgi:hypothetical protein